MNSLKPENKEIEIKLTLSSFTDYLKLIGFVGKADKKVRQLNIFYDTASGQISKLGYALRLRIESDRGIVTLKSTTIQKGKAAVRNEIEESITLETAKEVQQNSDLLSLQIAPILYLLSQSKGLHNLKPIVQFENERIKKEIDLHDSLYVFEIDKTEYSEGRIDYELEIELSDIDKIDDAESDLQKLFKVLEIEFIVQKKSKLERALEIAGHI